MSLRVLPSARLPVVIFSLSLALAAPPAGAQQFVSRDLPGPVVWSESAAALDADEDGDLDLFIVNANGWSMPGDLQPDSQPLAPTLLRNDGNDLDGFPIWTDASAALLPAGLVLHGKSVAVFDADGDGRQDLAIAVAFGGRQRLLRKDPLSGTFLDESATRLPTLVLNAMSVAAGDVDDDGDLDLVFSDAGASSFGAPGGLARLLLNDGAGHFIDAPEQLGAALKIGAQNAKLIDLDGDCDLDLVVDGKSPTTQFYENDGAGQFELKLNVVPGSTQPGYASTYESDFCDLDGDGDFDAVIMNTAFQFVDSVTTNQLAQMGQLRFSLPDAAVFDDNNCHDENDFAFLDADDDGDLDLLVGALPFPGSGCPNPDTSEKLFLNMGPVGTGSMSWVSGAFDAGPDATLDLELADFDGDGAYDVVSVQGEYFPPFINRYYRNTGPADSQPPSVLATSATPATVPLSALAGGWPRRAVLQDSIMDDGVSYLQADLVVSTDKGGETSMTSSAMAHVGGSTFRGVVDPAPSSTGLVGMDVSWHVRAEDPAGNSVESAAQTTRLCGVEAYGAPTPTSAVSFGAAGEPTVGDVFTLQVAGGPAGAGAVLLVGFGRVEIAKKGGLLLVDPAGLILIDVTLDGGGGLALPVNLPTGLGWAGLGLSAQVAVFDGAQSHGVSFSNALELVVCGEP